MWTSRNRARYGRSKLRYPSDVTDEEWELIVPLIPPGKSGGGKRTVWQDCHPSVVPTPIRNTKEKRTTARNIRLPVDGL